MLDDAITDAKDLLKRVSDFGEELKERRRFERQKLLWAATVEVRGQRFEGMIVDLSAGGARIKFDAPVAAGDELTLVLKQLDDLGARVVWQREGEAGLQFLLAPDEVAERIQQMLPQDAPPVQAATPAAPEPRRPAPAAAKPRPAPAQPAPRAKAAAPPRRRRRFFLFTVLGLAGLAAAVGGGLVVADFYAGEPLPILSLTGGASDQHSCNALLNKVGGSSNEVDFSLNVASAAHAKCLDVHHLAGPDDNNNGHMVRTTKVPIQ